MPVNSQNVEALREAIAAARPDGRFMPAVYVVETTSRCNLQCVMCPNPRMTPSNWGNADAERFCQVMDEIAPYCEFLMLYWMGEPLLHPDFELLLREARKRIQGRIVVSSNMTSMEDSVADCLLQNADIVLCCIDRWEKSAYERVRRGATFESVIENTQRLLERRMPDSRCTVIVKALDLKSNGMEYERFREYWKMRGATPMLAWLNDWAGSLPTVRNAAQMAIPLVSDTRSPCTDLWFKMVVNWRGEVQMCCFDWDYKYSFGQVGVSTSLASIWQSEKLVALRKEHLAGNWSVNSLCKTCSSWGEARELDAYVDFDEQSHYIVF